MITLNCGHLHQTNLLRFFNGNGNLKLGRTMCANAMTLPTYIPNLEKKDYFFQLILDWALCLLTSLSKKSHIKVRSGEERCPKVDSLIAKFIFLCLRSCSETSCIFSIKELTLIFIQHCFIFPWSFVYDSHSNDPSTQIWLIVLCP